MILLDYSAVAIANIMVGIKRDGEQLTKFFALHMILNSIRVANKKFSRDYGTMIICCDAKTNWRNDVFDYYKWKRKNDRKKDDIDWDLVYECLDYTKEALDSGFPYNVITVDNSEADDIIGALAVYATENEENTVIVSNDKDFIQLHSESVCQFRPMEQAFVRHPEPRVFLKELVLRGDTDDGVPNIKSPDDIFTIKGKRQKSMYAKEVDVWKYDEDNTFLTDETKDNYYRNKRLIDLTFTPKDVKVESVRQLIDNKQRTNKAKMTRFFIKHQLRYLHERISDFE